MLHSEYRDHRDMSRQIISALISVCCWCRFRSRYAVSYLSNFVFVWPFLGFFCYFIDNLYIFYIKCTLHLSMPNILTYCQTSPSFSFVLIFTLHTNSLFFIRFDFKGRTYTGSWKKWIPFIFHNCHLGKLPWVCKYCLSFIGLYLMY